MSPAGIISDVLLAVGLAVVMASCLGMAVMRDALDRLHLVTPASTIGTAAVAASVVVRHGLDATGTSAILLAFVVAGSSPFVSHAMARSIAVRQEAEKSPSGDQL